MNWGIIATGNIAGKFAKTINLMAGEGQKLAAVGSRDLSRAEEFAKQYGAEKAYGSYEELCSDKNVNAVYIASPNNLHFENALMCLENSKHVLCEKPFTLCERDAKMLYDKAEEKRLFIMEGLWTRFLPLYGELLKIISSKKYGELRHARCEYGFIAEGKRRERKFLNELGGGALLDIGIYNLGFLNMVMGGEPERFDTEVRMNEYETDEYSVIQLVYPNGKTAQCLQTIGLQIERQAALYFDNASIYLPDFQGAYKMTVKENGGGEYTLEFPPDINGFEYEIREAENCISAGKTHSDIYTPRDSISLSRVMDSIRNTWGMKYSDC